LANEVDTDSAVKPKEESQSQKEAK
jgi:hypothetical protein